MQGDLIKVNVFILKEQLLRWKLVWYLLLELCVDRYPVHLCTHFDAFFSIESRIKQLLIIEKQQPLVSEKVFYLSITLAMRVPFTFLELDLYESSYFWVKIAINKHLLLINTPKFFAIGVHVFSSILSVRVKATIISL